MKVEAEGEGARGSSVSYQCDREENELGSRTEATEGGRIETEVHRTWSVGK